MTGAELSRQNGELASVAPDEMQRPPLGRKPTRQGRPHTTGAAVDQDLVRHRLPAPLVSLLRARSHLGSVTTVERVESSQSQRLRE